MSELENIQPQENLEGTESVEQVEEQTLQDATHEPGARVEETQTFEQAEAVEKSVTEAVDNVEVAEVEPGSGAEEVARPNPSGDGTTEIEATSINVPSPVENQVEGEGGDQVAHVDHWSEMPQPGDDPPPPNLEADDGSELMKEGQGDRPGDDVSATPINLP